jgi:hypothetical protein
MAEELGAVLFIQPQSTPELAKHFKGNGWLANTIGNPLDTTIVLQHLIFEGTLDRFPGLKIPAAHGGGYLASYAPRSDHAFFVAPANCDANIVLKKKPSEYLKQLYFDALVFKSNDEILSHHRGRNCPVHSSKIHRQCLRWVSLRKSRIEHIESALPPIATVKGDMPGRSVRSPGRNAQPESSDPGGPSGRSQQVQRFSLVWPIKPPRPRHLTATPTARDRNAHPVELDRARWIVPTSFPALRETLRAIFAPP